MMRARLPAMPDARSARTPTLGVAAICHLVAATAVTLGFVACSGEPDAAELPGPEPVCTLGAGSTIFEPLTDGDELAIVSGPQGGFHVWGTFRASGIEPGDFGSTENPTNPTTVFSVHRDNGDRVGGTSSLRQGLKQRSDGTLELVGEPVILGIASPEQLAGKIVDLSVEIVDSDGVEARDERSVVLGFE